MAFALANATTNASVADLGTVTIPATTLGNLIVVCIGESAARTLTSVTDDKGNTYTLGNQATNTNTGAIIASARDAVGGVTVITIDISGAATCHVDVLEFSGVKSSGTYRDVNSNGSAASGTAVANTSFTPTAGALIVAVGAAGGLRTWTKDAAYTKGSTDSGSLRSQSQYLLSASGGAETAPQTINSTSSWATAVESYLPQATTTAPPANALSLLGVG
jgi:hypothetical protein